MIDRLFLSAPVGYKGVAVGMFFVCFVAFPITLFPLCRFYFREIGINLSCFGINLCQAEFVGQRHSLSVEAGSTYYIYMLLLATMVQGVY